ncbi:MAG: BamA/TamA family outer membrane protein [Bacteroidales bacterium]|nr:BamA/TamA family outer membrane protein [Bacteroidales bacterium]
MNTRFINSIFFVVFSTTLFAYGGDTTKTNTKSGWSFGAVPVVAFDSDIGFKYGGLVNFYHYGDGSIYPDYKHSIYLEWSRTTKGSGINQLTYDSKYLVPGIRVSGEASYLTEQTLDFYGYNGYKSDYFSTYEADSSRVFYRLDRKLLRLRADFQGKTPVSKLYWMAGIVHYNIKLDTVDIHKLNEGKKANDLLPPVNGGLFGFYRENGLIPSGESDGGTSTLFKAGLVYDSRDNEPNPMKGIWTSLLVLADPGFLSESKAYGKFVFTHRQYFTIVPKRFSFAYRLAYQGKLYGRTPVYMLPFVFNSGRFTDRDGLGGSKTMRGILRNRVVGEDMAYGNFELRWKFLNTVVAKQNIYLALSAFTDMGLVTRDYEIANRGISPHSPTVVTNQGDGLHQSIGGGFRFALNENFIIAVDYGVPLDKRDGEKNGLYINMDWLF